MVPRTVKDLGTAKECAVLFVKSGRVAEVIQGSIEDYWNNIYDWFDDSDFMVIENLNGNPLCPRQTGKILKRLIEDMSEDGYPLIWRKYRGALFIALDRQAAPFGKLAFKQYRLYLNRQALQDAFGDAQVRRLERSLGRAGYRPPPRQEKFDFYGFLSRDIVDQGKPVKYRLSLDGILKRAERLRVKSDAGRWLQQCITAFEHFIRGGRLYRDRDLEELVDFLWDQLSDVLEEEGCRIEPWINASSLYADRSDRLEISVGGYSGRESPPLPVLAQALRSLSIGDDYFSWLQSCITKLYDDEELRSSASIHELASFLFELLEDGAKTYDFCIWCKKKAIPSGHYDACKNRQRALFGRP